MVNGGGTREERNSFAARPGVARHNRKKLVSMASQQLREGVLRLGKSGLSRRACCNCSIASGILSDEAKAIARLQCASAKSGLIRRACS